MSKHVENLKSKMEQEVASVDEYVSERISELQQYLHSFEQEKMVSKT